MTGPLPILVLAGSDRRPGPLPPGLAAEAMLTGFKGALPLPSGRCLAAELVERLRQTRRFADPILVGPRPVYGGLVDCELIDVAGPLAATLTGVARVIQDRFDQRDPVAISTCDILPTAAEILELLETAYDPAADCRFWWQMVLADPKEMGASHWKPHYAFQPAAGEPLATAYPGHLLIVRPGALRMEMFGRLLVAAYRYRNRPVAERFLPLLFQGLGILLQQDLRNLVRMQMPMLTCSVPWHILRAYRGLRNGRLTLPDLERHLTRAILHRRDRSGPRACAIALTRILSFAKDIDTLAELQQVCSQL